MPTQENALGRYTILRELGRGPLGGIWAARDRETGAVVALKTLDPALLRKSGASFADQFLKGARSARRLKHRNIVEVLDAGEMGGAPYVAMEMLEGESLRTILDGKAPGIARAIDIIHQAASGLAYAHLEGVVHGGIRPSNLIVLRSGLVKITDFGIAQLQQATAPNYQSPEQLQAGPVDHRSDIFSLGAVFYEMLTHRPAGEGKPSELNPLVPRALDEIVARMLARQPSDRMPGVPILLRELERVKEGLGVLPAPVAAKEEPRTRSRPAEEFPHRKLRTHRESTDDAALFAQAREGRLDDMMEREPWPEHSSRWRPAIYAALAVSAIGLGIAGFMHYSPGSSEPSIARAPEQQAPAPAPDAPRPTKAAPVTESVSEPVMAAAAPPATPPPAVEQTQAQPEPLPAPSVAAPTPPPPAPEPVASAVAPSAKPLPRQTRTTTKPPEQRTGTAQVILAVSPRGEIYIDGKHHGTTPPTTTFDLEPGMHRIEVRSGSRRPYVTYMTVQAGEVRRIRHDFNAQPIRPPA